MNTVRFDGPCPLWRCCEIEPHEHVVCEYCGCIGATNILCPHCIAYMDSIGLHEIATLGMALMIKHEKGVCCVQEGYESPASASVRKR